MWFRGFITILGGWTAARGERACGLGWQETCQYYWGNKVSLRLEDLEWRLGQCKFGIYLVLSTTQA